MNTSATHVLISLTLFIASAFILLHAAEEQFLSPAPKPVEKVSIISIEGLVNINTADLQALMSLKGIGEVKAQRIIEFRTGHGVFVTPEDITRVDGIGQGIFEQIKDRITV